MESITPFLRIALIFSALFIGVVHADNRAQIVIDTYQPYVPIRALEAEIYARNSSSLKCQVLREVEKKVAYCSNYSPCRFKFDDIKCDRIPAGEERVLRVRYSCRFRGWHSIRMRDYYNEAANLTCER